VHAAVSVSDPVGVRLAIVRIDQIHPHEIADPARERRIEERLLRDGMLRDPLIVGSVPDVDGYVLLDGTNRRRALDSIGLAHAMVQIIDYRDQNAVHLRTWCHLARLPLESIRRAVETIEGLTVISIPPLGMSEALAAHDTLAVALDPRAQYALARTSGAPTSADQLRPLIDLYEDRMVRVDCDSESLEERARSLDDEHALVAFRGFSRSQVVMMAMRQTLIPAGITRHMIRTGRALRVNLPLAVLALPDVGPANEALESHLRSLQPRFYREPTILYDS